MPFDITAKELNELEIERLNPRDDDIISKIIEEAAINGQAFYKTDARALSRALTYRYSDIVQRAKITKI